MHERVNFASQIVARLAAAGVKPLPTYDAGSDMLVVPQNYGGQTVHILLSRYFERYRMALHPRAKEQVLDDFVRFWLSGSLETSNLQPHRWLPLLRSRWHFEVSKLRLGGAPLPPELQQSGLFAFRLITDDLALTVAEDLGETYRFLSPLDLKQAGLTLEQALQRAFANLPPASGPGLSEPPFEEMQGLAWLPTGNRDEHYATRLLDVAAIRKLPVRGQHVAFAPHTHVLWISGTYQHQEVGLLVELAMQECDDPPDDLPSKPLVSGPLVLDEDGRWHPWHPAPEHPNYWNVKRLHTLGNEQIYSLQKEVLDQQRTGNNLPFVASYRALETGREGSGRLYSYCLFTVTSLLPRTEYVMLLTIANEAELAANPKAEPRFGESLVLTWESFAAFNGENLRPQGMYPERYYIDQFPDDLEWKKLKSEQQDVAREFLDIVLKPDFRNDRSPVRHPSPVSKRPPVSGTPAAGPQSANWMLAIMAAIIVVPAALILAVGVMFYLFIWIPTQAARKAAPRAGPPMPFVAGQPPVAFPVVELQVFNDEWHAMDEPLALPIVEGSVPAIGLDTTESRREQPTSTDSRGNKQFSERSPNGEPLVGLRIIQGDNWGGAIQALQPVYSGPDRYFLGSWHGAPGGKQQAQSIAEPGYAIGAIQVHQGLVVNAVRIEYWRMEDGKLDPSDKYVTDWYGCPGGGKQPPMSSSQGNPLIGITGKFHEDIHELRVIVSTND